MTRWELAEKSRRSGGAMGCEYFVGEEKPLYGPKIDIMIEDALGRSGS